MSNAALKTVGTNRYASSDNAHYNIPRLPWFKSAGIGEIIPTFTPDIHISNYEFVTNDQATNSGHTYITNQQDPFWPGDALGGGFTVSKPSSNSLVFFNYKISGGNGIWMPCPIFRSISYYWNNRTSFESNFIPHMIGLVLKNWRTDEEKTIDLGFYRYRNTAAEGELFRDHNDGGGSISRVRSQGRDWFIYGVILNFRSNQSSSNQAPESTLTDFRLGYYHNPGEFGTYRMCLTKEQSWSELKEMMSSGIRRYQ